jgi:hypothetical protein
MLQATPQNRIATHDACSFALHHLLLQGRVGQCVNARLVYCPTCTVCACDLYTLQGQQSEQTAVRHYHFLATPHDYLTSNNVLPVTMHGS